MRNILPALAIISTLIFTACDKAEKITTTSGSTVSSTGSMDMEVELFVEGDSTTITINGEEVEELPDGMMIETMQMIGNDGGEIIVMVDGQEQTIDLQGLLSGMDLAGMDGEVNIEVMAFGDDEEHAMHKFQADGENVQMFVTLNGKEVEGMSGDMSRDMMGHVMQMICSEHGGQPEGMREHMMHGGEYGGPHQQFSGEWRSQSPHQMHDKGQYHAGGMLEEMQFVQELDMLGQVAVRLDDREAVALMGIHIIRDELEGEIRMDALEAIIDDSGPIARNAALLVAIQTMLEEGDEEAAADYMVELVLSN